MTEKPLKQPREPRDDGYRYYNAWSGNPKGTREDKTCCVESVYCSVTRHSRQCSRKRGHGPDGLWCKQHDPLVEREKERKWNEKFNLDTARGRAKYAEPVEILKALKQIAKGHNDPRTLAKEVFQKIIDRRKELGLDVKEYTTFLE